MIASGVTELVPVVGISVACSALALSRANHYRRARGRRLGPPASPPSPVRALSETERTTVLDLLQSERFIDASPAATCASLLDEGTYRASEHRPWATPWAHGHHRGASLEAVQDDFELERDLEIVVATTEAAVIQP